MELKRNMTSEWVSLLRRTPRSRKSTLLKTLSFLSITCSLPWPNSRPIDWMDTRDRKTSSTRMLQSLPLRTSLTQSTGSRKVLSTQSRTKVSVDHAGPFPLLLPLRVPISSKQVSLFHSLSSNSLTVTPNPMVATVDGNPTLSTGPTPMVRILRATTFTQQKPGHVKKTSTNLWLMSSPTRLSPNIPLHNSRPPLLNNLSQWLLRLIDLFSNNISQVFWTPRLAEPILITLSLQSVMEPRTARITISLETPGVHPGEIKDTSRLQPLMELVSVVSNKHQSTQQPTD